MQKNILDNRFIQMKKIFLLFLIIPLLSFNLHKLHVSLTKIVYKKETKTLQITTRLFIDDIENALDKKYGIKTELDNERELKNTDGYLEKYLKENLQIVADNKNINLQYLGKEYEDDIVYLYFEMENIPDFKQLTIKNTLLFDLFEDQRNIVKFKKGNFQKTIYLTKDLFRETLTIQ